MIYSLGDTTLTTASDDYFIAPSADVIGDVHLGNKANVWWNVVIRADNDPITIGDSTNIQDGSVLHTDPGFPIDIGANVTVGHMCMLHGCTVGDGCLIGIGSIILNGTKIGKNCLIGANSLITEGKDIPDNSLVMGSPGKVIREVDEKAIAMMARNIKSYVDRSERYRAELKQMG
ncbi:MAG: gamma carbonic anhydrase family protein [Rhodospirillaceae bacterium]|nr:gamma carbonic anhydrase family protein [Rhodospirillaceae bacterium]|tara:strand:+ start:1406 stop:1930 length:525 start_codon:yes stop_codon:yes gene_type:complete